MKQRKLPGVVRTSEAPEMVVQVVLSGVVSGGMRPVECPWW